MDDGVCSSSNIYKGETNDKKDKGAKSNSLPPPIELIPEGDADLYSINMSFGAGRWYVALGVDIVVTDDEIGVFTTQGIGPDTQILGIDSSEMDKYKRKNFGESEEYRNGYSIIDVGVSFIKAELYGDSLTQSVANYAGISQVGGFSIPVFTFLAMTSVDSKTKEPDYAITGLGYGLNIGPLPVEIHDNFSVAKPLWIFPKK